MSKRLDENLGSVGFDNLITDSYPPTDVFSVQLAAGQGVLLRGTLLALKSNGTMEIIGSATTGKANAVLAELADTGASSAKTQSEESQAGDEQPIASTEAETVPGIAYRTGHFNTNRLIVADGYTITEADREALRIVGILTSEAVEI